MRNFSKHHYMQIIRKYARFFTSYQQVLSDAPANWAILRHDVEFSPERALQVGIWDMDTNIRSHFFFQVVSASYNVFDFETTSIIRQLEGMGHSIGLHAYTHSEKTFIQDLAGQTELLQKIANAEIEVFSFHRPRRWSLSRSTDRELGLINAYGPAFFQYSPEPDRVRYLADSRHAFNYGDPLALGPEGRFQINLHPDEWSVGGHDLRENFASLRAESQERLERAFAREADHYRR